MRQNEYEFLVKSELLFSRVSGDVWTLSNVGVKERCASF